MLIRCLLLIAIPAAAGCLPSASESDSSSADDDGVVTPMIVVDDDEPGREPSIADLRRQFKLGDREFAKKDGGKIRAVDLSRANVSDLSPLRGLELVSLDLLETKVADLNPLSGMPLRELYAEKTRIADLEPLAGMPLVKLHLGETPVRDLKPLAGMSLEELNLNGAKIESLVGVEDIRIGTLWIPKTGVKDLTPLAGSSLVSLDIEDTPVESLAPLSRMTSLKRLNIAGSAVTDLTPLKDLELERLLFTPSKVKRGVDLIRNIQTIRELGVAFDAQMPPAEFWPMYDAGSFEEAKSGQPKEDDGQPDVN